MQPDPHPSELVARLLERTTLPPAGSPIDCAVSGGADSSALLILACAAGCDVIAHHVDHGLRPDSGAEADIVRTLATQQGARFVGHSVSVDAGPNLEARARQARFSVLPRSVATGHTLDDRAETVLINLIRGAARTGLSPLRPSLRHPIVALRRAETVALCEAFGVPYVRDPSNQDPAFVRNRVRHEVLPLLDEISNRDVSLLLDRQASVLGEEDAFLDELASQLDATDAKALAAAPAVLARRAIRRFITESWPHDHPPGTDSIERVLAVAQGDAVSCEIEGGHRVYRSHQKMRLEPSSGTVNRS